MSAPDLYQAAAMWQAMRASGKLEVCIALAPSADLLALRAFLRTQNPDALINLGLGLVENEMLDRFEKSNTP